MSFSMGSREQTTQQNQTAVSNPYEPARDDVNRFLTQIDRTSRGGGRYQPNAAEQAAFDQLRANAEAGNPYADQIGALANDLFATQSYAPQLQQGYADLERRLSGTADGANLDIENNPYISKMLSTVTNDAVNRVNSQFAAAGRDFSGYNQQALGRGITEAQLPVLAQLYQYEQGRSDAAARDLYAAKGETARGSAQLDQLRSSLRAMGIDVGNAALDAQNWGANQVLAIENQLRNLPYDELDRIAALLYPAAGLGGTTTTTGTSTTEGSSSGFGGSLADIGKLAAGIAALSDERAKTDIARIGALADGTPIYRYRYKGWPFWHMGVLAQEIEARNPEAVCEINGLKCINVLKVTARSEAILNEGAGDDA